MKLEDLKKMNHRDIDNMMRQKGFNCIFGHDPETNLFFAIYKHEATRLACITMEPGRYSHVPIHPSLFHEAETFDDAVTLAAEAALAPLSKPKDPE
jgi:hypothetical protein